MNSYSNEQVEETKNQITMFSICNKNYKKKSELKFKNLSYKH